MSTATLIIEKEKILIPQLRFKEFDSQLDSYRIEDVSKKVTSGSRDWAQYYSESGDKFIRMTNLPKKGINLLMDDLKYVKLPERSSEGKRTSLDSGDVLISITAELGKIAWIPDNLGLAYINQHTALIKLKSKVDSKYVAYQLSTKKNNIKLNRLNDSGAKSGLNLSTIRSFLIPFPSLPEQQKIASFLSAVDEKIQQLSRKKELLEQYKKGVMQQLFSGKLQFKDENGKNYADWEEKRLGDVCEIVGGGTPDTNIPEYWGGEIQWFTPTEIKSDFVSNSIRTITELGLQKSSAKKLPIGTILLTTRATIGEVSIAREECSTNQGFQSLIARKGNSNSFIFNWIKQNKHELTSRANGSTFPEISKTAIEKIFLNAPSFPEQQKIANFLSNIDTKIETTNQQINQTQSFKKGLLQQMFV